ncbi:Protein F37C4.5 [Lamellibrachia satsuma]|nr:Protein F37C4.5 [Lamellibrachia satsuma]
MYDSQTARLDESLHSLEQQIKHLDEDMDAIRKNLAGMNATSMMNEARVLCVLLDVIKDTEVQLKVSYVVSKAMWSPKYDLRVFSKDGQMKIFYYGIVQQTTGEDWTDTQLILSTAMPSVGGNIPELNSWKLGFKPKQPIPMMKSNSFLKRAPAQVAKMRRAITNKKAVPAAVAEEMVMYAAAYDDESDDFETGPLVQTQAQVKENVTSTMYEIPRTATIPCDNVGHKVSVAIIDLEPTFQHECVPKKSSHAFLRAHVKNTSPYALLAGPSNIFLDNNFIAKADLKAVSPSEEFDCSLGVDPAVKVVYKPMHKFREQSGFMAKHVKFTYKQDIEIKNTRQDNISIHVIDQLPQSTEDKIKVKLLEPDVKPVDKHAVSKPAQLNSQNNIEWDITVSPGEAKELVLKYSVEYPAGEEIM